MPKVKGEKENIRKSGFSTLVLLWSRWGNKTLHDQKKVSLSERWAVDTEFQECSLRERRKYSILHCSLLNILHSTHLDNQQCIIIFLRMYHHFLLQPTAYSTQQSYVQTIQLLSLVQLHHTFVLPCTSLQPINHNTSWIHLPLLTPPQTQLPV